MRTEVEIEGTIELWGREYDEKRPSFLLIRDAESILVVLPTDDARAREPLEEGEHASVLGDLEHDETLKKAVLHAKEVKTQGDTIQYFPN